MLNPYFQYLNIVICIILKFYSSKFAILLLFSNAIVLLKTVYYAEKKICS